jgi:peptide/nickel transport system permease protein
MRFLLRRITSFPVTLFGASIFVFLLMHMVPGDVTVGLLGPMASPAARASIRAEFGLDRSLPEQYLHWISHILQGDLGTSWLYKETVSQIVLPKFLNTLLLAGTSATFAISMGVVLGYCAALYRDRTADHLISGVAVLLGSTPQYWLGLVLVILFSIQLGVLPATGMHNMLAAGGVLDVARHLILPTVTAALPSMALITKMTRSSLVEAAAENFVMFARSKGVPYRRIMSRHVLLVVSPTIVSVAGLEFGYLLGGILLVEVVFGWPGLGRQVYDSVVGRDIPTVQAAVLLLVLAFCLINLGADVFHWLIDPKLRRERGGEK